LHSQKKELHTFYTYPRWSNFLDLNFKTPVHQLTFKDRGERYITIHREEDPDLGIMLPFDTNAKVISDDDSSYYYNIYQFTEVINEYNTWVRLDVVGTYSAIIVSENDKELSLYQEVYSGLSLIGDIIAEEAKNSKKRKAWKDNNGIVYQILLLDPFYNP
jgi:hypothetical protein